MTIKPRTRKLMEFMKVINDFSLIERQKRKDDNTWETDSEHSYQVAMVCWYLNESYDLNLDVSKLLQYALIHDIAEVKAGDVHSIETYRNQMIKSRKKENEHISMHQLSVHFKECPGLWNMHELYEKQSDPESQLVFAVDKFVAFANMYLMKKDRYCHEHKVTKEEYCAERRPRIQSSPVITALFEDLLITVEQAGIFYRK